MWRFSPAQCLTGREPTFVALARRLLQREGSSTTASTGWSFATPITATMPSASVIFSLPDSIVNQGARPFTVYPCSGNRLLVEVSASETFGGVIAKIHAAVTDADALLECEHTRWLSTRNGALQHPVESDSLEGIDHRQVWITQRVCDGVLCYAIDRDEWYMLQHIDVSRRHLLADGAPLANFVVVWYPPAGGFLTGEHSSALEDAIRVQARRSPEVKFLRASAAVRAIHAVDAVEVCDEQAHFQAFRDGERVACLVYDDIALHHILVDFIEYTVLTLEEKLARAGKPPKHR